MKNSKIEWTDHTFNGWIGCTKVSPGCLHCYAERDFDLRKHVAKWGPGNPRHRTSEAYWKQPLKWDRDYAELVRCANLAGEHPPRRPRVFCGSLCDWLDPEVPISWLWDLLDLIRRTPNLDWLLLTKRPENFANRLGVIKEKLRGPMEFADAVMKVRIDNMLIGWESSTFNSPEVGVENYWLGTTVEDQHRADERIPHLLSIPARVRFLSCEPLLGPVDLCIGDPKHRTAESYHAEIHWVICGGESGPHARPMHPDWARSLRDQCKAANVPFFFKQWGEHIPWEFDEQEHNAVLRSQHGRELWYDAAPRDPCNLPKGWDAFWFEDTSDATLTQRVGKAAAGFLLDGVEYKEFPR